MKLNNKKGGEQKKRRYSKPRLERVRVDKNITMVMMTDPPIDPETSTFPDHFQNNPFKI